MKIKISFVASNEELVNNEQLSVVDAFQDYYDKCLFFQSKTLCQDQ